jgi:hypothetical protein
VCKGEGPDSAPLDEYDNPHTHYGRLWLLDTDRSAGFPLTEFPADPPIVVDFGYRDAWPAGKRTLLQWSGDCGASSIADLNPDGTGDVLAISMPEEVVLDGVELIDVVDEGLTIHGWPGCDAGVGSLFGVDLEGHYLDTMVRWSETPVVWSEYPVSPPCIPERIRA